MRIKAIEMHRKNAASDINALDVLGTFERWVYTTFNIDNMYLVK